MIEIQLKDGTALRLDSKTKILLKKKNILFHDEIIPVPHTLPFTVPTKGNEAALNHQHLHHTLSADYEIEDVTLLVYGNVELKGVLVINSSNKDRYEIELRTAIDGDIKIATLFPNSVLGSDPGSDAGSVNVKSWPEVRYCWASYINDDEYFNATYMHKYVNRHDSSGFTLTSVGNLVPLGISLYLGYVLKTIANGLGLTARGALFEDQELMKIIIWNNFIFRWNGGNWEAPENLLVPDLTVNEFLVSIKKWLGVKITINQNTNEIWFDLVKSFKDAARRLDITDKTDRLIPIDFSQDNGMNISLSFSDSYNSSATKSLDNIIITGSINLSSDLASSGAAVGTYWYCRGDNAVYFINETGQHEFFAYNYEPAEIGDGDKNISVDAGPLTEFLDYPDVEEQLLPRINHPISDLTQRNTFGLHLLFFRGDAETAQSAFTYPLATAHNLKLIQTNPNYEVIGEYSLYPDGPYGTYEKLWKRFEQWISKSKLIQTKLYWDAKDWRSFDERDLLLIESNAYVWKEMDLYVSLQGIEYVKTELVKA